MKTLKLTLSVFILSGFAACASVTDANIDAPAAHAETTTQADAGDIWDNSNGDDMDPIIRRPTSGGTYYD